MKIERDGEVFVITMQREENRFNPDHLDELEAALDEVEGAEGPVTAGDRGGGEVLLQRPGPRLDGLRPRGRRAGERRAHAAAHGPDPHLPDRDRRGDQRPLLRRRGDDGARLRLPGDALRPRVLLPPRGRHLHAVHAGDALADHRPPGRVHRPRGDAHRPPLRRQRGGGGGHRRRAPPPRTTSSSRRSSGPAPSPARTATPSPASSAASTATSSRRSTCRSSPERWRPRRTRGLSRLEAVVLGLLVDEPAHGYALKARLAPGMPRERQVNDGVLYPLLAAAGGARPDPPRGRRPGPDRGRRGGSSTRRPPASAPSPSGCAPTPTRASDLDYELFLDHPLLKLLFASHLSPPERRRKVASLRAAAEARLAALDDAAARRRRARRTRIGPIVLELGRSRERALIDALDRDAGRLSLRNDRPTPLSAAASPRGRGASRGPRPLRPSP